MPRRNIKKKLLV